MSDGLLLYLQGGAFPRRPDGTLGVHSKTASGLRAFASRWDGPVAVSSLQPPHDTAEAPAGLEWAKAPNHDGFLVFPALSAQELSACPPAVIHTSLNTPGAAALPSLGIPLVFGDDNAPNVRTEILLLNAHRPLDRLRIRVGALRARRRFDRLAGLANGFHANGYASFAHYERLNSHALRYFDHRITVSDLEQARERQGNATDRLHIAYSGRLIGIKGVQHIPLLADELTRRRLQVRISVLGGGLLEKTIAASAGIEYRGYLPFEPDWKEFMQSVDLMFLPHLQGDSSSTYYESMGIGVPVLGYANRTLSPLLRDGGGGWQVTRGDISGAADIIETLAYNRSLLGEQSARALRYMRRIPMEKMFDERVADFARASMGGKT